MNNQAGIEPFVLDSITVLPPASADRVVLAASHAGTYTAMVAIKARLRSVVLHDAGLGRDQAGVAGLRLLSDHGIPAAAIDYRSARIGDGADCLARGVLSTVNDRAAACGLQPGDAAGQALERLLVAAPLPGAVNPPPMAAESRVLLMIGVCPVRRLDSAALVRTDDAGTIVITGSHGGLLGGRPETAIKVPVFAAVYNDAGVGIDQAGISRLPALEARGIAAMTVAALSARIGDARSTHEDGIVSHVNGIAVRFGIRPGLAMTDAAIRLAQAWEVHAKASVPDQTVRREAP